MSDIIERAIAWAYQIAADNAQHGYDQASRWGPSYDCSSYVISAFRAAGLTLPGASYTGNMLNAFLADGFEIVHDGSLQRGDVLLNVVNHTAIYYGNNQLIQASINENGGITGGAVGDQTGNGAYGGEIGISSYYNYPWDYVLRYTRDDAQSGNEPFKIHAKNTGYYTTGSTESIDNCNAIGYYLQQEGFSLAAIAGILGNVYAESGYNPWRWQSDNVLSTNDDLTVQAGHAYGLFQFDPPGNYINNPTAQAAEGYGPNFSNRAGKKSDLIAQVKLICTGYNYYPSAGFPISFADYKTMTDASAAAAVWFSNFERGTWSEIRRSTAEYWYNYFSQHPFHKRIPLWLLFKLRS